MLSTRIACRLLGSGHSFASLRKPKLSYSSERILKRLQNQRVAFSTRAHAEGTEPLTAPSVEDITANVTPKLLIDGDFVDAASGKTFPVIDPRNEEVVMNVAEAEAEDVDRAVKAARRAFDEGPWPRLSGRERGRILIKFADLLDRHNQEIGKLNTLEGGLPVQASFAEAAGLSGQLRYFASWADKIHGKTIPVDGKLFAYTLHEPVGVVGEIIPWNFPLILLAYKICPALATGNTVVVKCAEQTPMGALRVAELALEAGIPKGVFNVVPGGGPTAGASLAAHPLVDKIAFTGSTEVGQLIMQLASGNLKRVSLELGGKSPIIIYPDFDLDQVAHIGLFLHQGQMCMAASRTFVHADIYDEFLEKAAAMAKNKVVGDPFTKVDHGPLIEQRQLDRVLGYVKCGLEEGADLLCGGKRIGDKGFYMEPTVFANVKNEMKIAQEEIFGPVQSIIKFESTDEVIRLANDTQYGLVAAVLSNDLNTANRVSRSLRAGTIWVNGSMLFDPALPFGGYKMSGFGRDLGEYALDEYTEVKTVVMPLEDSPWLSTLYNLTERSEKTGEIIIWNCGVCC